MWISSFSSICWKDFFSCITLYISVNFCSICVLLYWFLPILLPTLYIFLCMIVYSKSRNKIVRGLQNCSAELIILSLLASLSFHTNFKNQLDLVKKPCGDFILMEMLTWQSNLGWLSQSIFNLLIHEHGLYNTSSSSDISFISTLFPV